MKIIKTIFVLSCVLFVFACKNTGHENNPVAPTEKAKLISIKVGNYPLTNKELMQAQSDSGFTKDFESNFQASARIVVEAEDKATKTFEPTGSENITLRKTPQTISITLRKNGKLDNICKLILSKKEEVSPPTPQVLPFDDMIEVSPPENGIIGRTFNSNALQYDGVFLKDRVVKLSKFSVAKYELTYKIWHAVTEWAKTHGYTFTGQAKEGIKTAVPNAEPRTDNLPVTQVNWYDAIIWCNAYTEMTKSETECVYREENASGAILKDATDQELYKKVFWDKTKKGYRLLSEAEWEYVARYQKDNSNGVGREYDVGTGVWLTKIDTVSGASKNWKDADQEETAKYCWWTSDVTQQMPKAVDGRLANHLGVHDMSGNMMEWVYDWYKVSEEKSETVLNPEGPALDSLDVSTLQKVMKGGAYNSVSLMQCLPAYRNGRRTAGNQGDHMDSGVRLAFYK